MLHIIPQTQAVGKEQKRKDSELENQRSLQHCTGDGIHYFSQAFAAQGREGAGRP